MCSNTYVQNVWRYQVIYIITDLLQIFKHLIVFLIKVEPIHSNNSKILRRKALILQCQKLANLQIFANFVDKICTFFQEWKMAILVFKSFVASIFVVKYHRNDLFQWQWWIAWKPIWLTVRRWKKMMCRLHKWIFRQDEIPEIIQKKPCKCKLQI